MAGDISVGDITATLSTIVLILTSELRLAPAFQAVGGSWFRC